jgi:hypothetical protein
MMRKVQAKKPINRAFLHHILHIFEFIKNGRSIPKEHEEHELSREGLPPSIGVPLINSNLVYFM